MKEERAIELLHVLRTGYICDPQDCGLEKGGDVCSIFECGNFHEALVMAIDALENRIVARELADNMVKTVRVKENEYEDLYQSANERLHKGSNTGRESENPGDI